AALIELGMRSANRMVDNPWKIAVRKYGVKDETLAAGTQILNVYDQLNGKLLILGDPGAGKNTTLLQLTRDLLERAEAEDSFPIPIIFNLSSWADERKPLAAWLIDQLGAKYQVPKRVSTEWITNDNLILLLDGLDEVPLAQREACVEAINIYRKE